MGKIHQARWKFWHLQKEKAYYKGLYGLNIVECFNFLEEYEIKPWFLVINIVNQDWIMKTIQKVHEGGFMGKWNDWAQFANANQERGTFREPVPDRVPDTIGGRQIWPILILCCAIYFVALVVWCLETRWLIWSLMITIACMIYKQFQAIEIRYCLLLFSITQEWNRIAGKITQWF